MKKNRLLNRTLSFGLALALFISSPASVYAEEMNDASVETIVENIDQGGASDEGESSGSDSTTASEEQKSETGSESNDSDQAGSGESTPEANNSNSEEQVNKGETPESSDETTTDEAETDADEKVDAEAEADADKDAEDEDEEITYDYESNNDGTHVKKWVDKDGVAHEETEDCEFGEDGKCIHCGYEKEEEEDDEEYKLSGTFTVTVSGYTVTAEVPEGAYEEEVKLSVDEIELSDEEKTLVDDELSGGVAISYKTFDIGFKNKSDKKLEPNDSVKISISSPSIIEDSEIIHIDDSGVAENVTVEASEGEVVFEAESFSTYTIAGVNYEYDSRQVLYNDTPYGSAFSTEKFNRSLSWAEEIGNNSYGLVIRYGAPTTQLRGDVIAPKDGYDRQLFNNDTLVREEVAAYVYGSGCNGKATIRFVAPENYYIEQIGVYKTYIDSYYVYPEYDTWKATYTPSTQYTTDYTQEISMIKGTTTTVRVFLKPIPTSYTSEKTIVKNATIVNYNNYTTTFGNYFKFNSGSDNYSSNTCHYGQVYQGLGSTTLDTTFRLATQNSNLLFPESLKASYITSSASNVGVEFVKDTNGYWTLDSKSYKYVYDSTNKAEDCNGVIEANSGTGFWPFQVNNGNDIHYGMELPIKFSVNSTGSTTDAYGNTTDTVFRFSGDDDVFVYIDGELVLDLGGIHNAVSGQINFKTGDVLIQGYDAAQTALTSSLDGSAYAKESIGTTNIYNILTENNVQELSLKEHTLTVVYFERGANVSNCRISFNFEKNETTNVSYEGLKLRENEDETYSPLSDATFTLYNDEECTTVAQAALGSDAIAVSDEDGSILFENLSIGVADANKYASKTYYMKETAAADQYQTPETALWKLVVTYDNGTYTKTLTAMNDEAIALSLGEDGKKVSSTETTVTGIVNYKTPVAKKLTITKVVSDGTNVNPDPNAKYVFYLGKYTGKDNSGNPVTTAVVNQEYKIGKSTYYTDEEGKFSLKADEVAIFENLYGTKYYVAEISVSDSEKDYTLKNYNTRIIVDNDYTSSNIDTYSNTVTSWRYKVLTYTDDSTEKTVKYENLFTDTTNNTQEKQLSKYITKNVDDYDLTLTFKSPVYTEQVKTTEAEDNFEKAKIDAVVVFDLSSSMSGSKLTNAKNAVNTMLTSINEDEVDAKWKLVVFGSTASNKTTNWVDASSLKNKVNGLSVYSDNDGGTNYQDALVEASTALNSGNRDGAKKVVIFITDGTPTFHLSMSHYSYYHSRRDYEYCVNGGTNYSNTCNHTDALSNAGYASKGGGNYTNDADYQGALMGAGYVDCDYFYAVGIDLPTTDVYAVSDYEKLDGLGVITKVSEAVTKASVKNAYNSSEDELTTVLSNIVGSFGTIYSSVTGEPSYEYASNARIIDELSEYVEIVQGSEFNISVLDADGNEVNGNAITGKLGESNATFSLTKDGKEYTFVASYSSEGYGKITLDLDSSSDYELGDYTYKVTFKVKPSEVAYDYMSTCESYPVINNEVTKGEAGTGITSENIEGFYSNNSAYASYKFRGGQVQNPYNKPVVQVENVWDWQIVKVGENTNNPLEGAEFTLAVPGNQGASVVYYGKTYDDGVIRWYANSTDRDNDIINNQVLIPAGNYTLIESKAPEGYAKSQDTWYITIDSQDGITGYINNEDNELIFNVDNPVSLSNGVTKKVAKIYFKNNLAYTLPETGGSGVYVYTIGGILLMIAGALLLYKNKNNKSK